MVRVTECEMETTAATLKTALNRFFRRYPLIDYWRGHLESMYETGRDFSSDELLANGEKDPGWNYALHLDVSDGGEENQKLFYICVIERV